MGDKRVFGSEWVVVLALAVLVVLLRWPSLEQPFDNDSGAIAYHARRIVRGEPLYGTHHPNHHLPAVYYAYALAFVLFGDSVWAVKFLLIPWMILTVYLVYRLGRLLVDRQTGLVAAVLFAVFASDIWLFGSSAEIEVFANLPRTAAVLVMMSLVKRRARPWLFLFVGVLSGVAFLFKAVYLSPLAMAGFVLLGQGWFSGSSSSRWHRVLLCGLWVALGFALPVLLVVGYYGSVGLLSRFLLLFTLGQGYVDMQSISVSPLYVFVYPLITLAARNPVIVVLAFSSMIMALREQVASLHTRRRRILTGTYVTLWCVLSFVEAGISRAAYLHYYQLLIPPFALLAARFVVQVYSHIRPVRRQAATAFLVLALVSAVGVSVALNSYHYSSYVRYRLGFEPYDSFVRDGWNPHLGEEFTFTQELADYVRAHTAPTDHIYAWSAGIQIYYLADRLCPVDIIWPLYAEATGSYERIFGEQTKYVILGESDLVPRADWLYTELAKQYVLETTIRGQEVYRRLD